MCFEFWSLNLLVTCVLVFSFTKCEMNSCFKGLLQGLNEIMYNNNLEECCAT